MPTSSPGGQLCRELRKHAEEICLPHLIGHEALAPVADDVTFAIVGSVATGKCCADSDIDIAVVVSGRTYAYLRSIVPDLTQRWCSGRPAQEIVGGRQLHWYAVSTIQVKRELLSHNDGAMYAYGTARALRDPHSRLRRIVARYGPQVEEVRASRIEGKLDMLLRRAQVLTQASAAGRVMVADIGLEVIKLGLKTVALLDGALGLRKDLEGCAFTGALGRRLRPCFVRALAGIGDIARTRRLGKQVVMRCLVRPLQEAIEESSGAARSLGLRVGLPRPDPRHAEPQPSVAALWARRSEWLPR